MDLMNEYDPFSFIRKYGDSSSLFEESASKTRYNDKHEEIPEEILEFNKKLNKFKYGVVKDGKVITDLSDFLFYKDYKSLSVSEFEKFEVGVCWDYTHYEADWFKSHNYKYETYYIEADSDDDSMTHTFLIFTLTGSSEVYYFESSWKIFCGIERFKNISDLLNTIKDRHIKQSEKECNKKIKKYICNKFDASSKSLEHIGMYEYMNKASGGKTICKNGQFEESGDTTRYNDKHEKIPDTCTKCGGEIGIFIQGEPVYLCKNCREYYGTVPFPSKKKSKSVQESAESDYSYTKLSSDSELKDYRDCMKSVFHSKDVFTDAQAKKWMYVIKYKNEVIGFIGFSHYTEKGRKLLGLGNFMIKPEYQDSGHGTNFIKYLIDKNKDECDEIYCYVEKKNTRAIEFYKKIGDVNTKNLTKYGYYVCLYKKEDEVMESFDEASLEFDDAFFEEALKDTTILRDRLYPKVEECLKVPANVKKLKKIISDFVEKNTDKLTTPGPQYLIVFGDQDKDLYYKLFEMKKEEVLSAMKDVVKETGSKSDFKYLLGNPFLALLYYIIRYFTYHKDEKALNGCLSMFAIDVYWSIFTKYFPNGVLEPFMNYTIDNLTDKFIIKKAGTIFAALTESARRSYGFHESKIKSGNDAECVSFMQRIRNDQNSMFRTLSQIYYKNYKEGNAIATRNDNYDPSNPIIDDVRTSSTEIQSVVDKTCMPMITNGIDIVLAEAAARMSNISITNLRIYLTKIFVSERLTEITQLVESMIFLFINESRRSVREIKSQYFLYWSGSLFKKTNSKDGNIIRINAILDKWGTDTGIYETFRSEGSRINYKKAIFLYIAMSVQKYT